MSQNRRITSSRLGRLSLLGRLAGGMAGSAASEGVRQLLKGRRPSIEDVFLTPKNMNRVADKLSEMRGAAMKLGQLMSMDSGQVLPEELTNLLEKLRDSAHHMPLGQVAKVLKASWGDKWDKNFKNDSFGSIINKNTRKKKQIVRGVGSRKRVWRCLWVFGVFGGVCGCLAPKIKARVGAQYPAALLCVASRQDPVNGVLVDRRLVNRELAAKAIVGEWVSR